MHSLLPFQARLLDRRFSDGLIDAGSLNGVEIEQEFLIVKSGSLENARSEIGFAYEEEDVLGTFTVTRVDDLLSEGNIAPAGFFDRINLNDKVIMSPIQKSEGDNEGDTGPDASADAEGTAEGAPTDESDTVIDVSSDRVDPLYRELLRIP